MQTLPYCVDCQRAYRHIQRHYRTRKHLRRATTVETECGICLESRPVRTIVQCTRCVYTWCEGCNDHFTRCPYCRLGPDPATPSGPPELDMNFDQLRERLRQLLMRVQYFQLLT